MNQLKAAKWLRLRCPRHEDFTAVIARDAKDLVRCPACRCMVETIAAPAKGSTTLELPAFFLNDGKVWSWNGKQRKKSEPATVISTEIVDAGIYP